MNAATAAAIRISGSGFERAAGAVDARRMAPTLLPLRPGACAYGSSGLPPPTAASTLAPDEAVFRRAPGTDMLK